MASKTSSKLRRRSRQSDSGTGQTNPPCPCDGASEPPHTPSAKSALQGGRMRGPVARGLRCALCGALVCRACSRVVRPSARIRLCGACFQHRELTCPSSEWFYRELRTKFHEVTPSPSSSSDSSLDVNLEVREFIERLTENLVSGSVDDVTVEPLSTHTQYEALCSQYHSSIQDTLSRLSQSLQLAITDFPANKITSGESPSELHVQLKRQIVELRHEAMQLPLLEMDMNSNDEEDEIAVTSASLDFSRRTYEDLLATAIINKVVENSQCVLMEEHLKTPTHHHVVGENCSQTCGTHDDTGTFISCFQIGIDDYETDPEEKEKEIDMETVTITETRRRLSEDEDSYLGSPENTSPDEEAEATVRRTETTRRTDTQRKTRTKRRVAGRSGISSDMQRFLEGLKYSHRVPFPELGADIVEGSVQESLLEETARTTLYLVNSDSHHSSLSSASWEENWLFQRRRLRLASARPQQNKKIEESRVPMLVPNPRAEDSHVRAKIGDMDADQLSSDLSDYESYMSREEGSSEPEDSLDSTRLHGEYALGKLLGESAPEDLIEATNEEVGATLILGPQNNGTESEFDQQEGEYLEDFASIGQRSLSSLQEASRSSLINEATKNLETVSDGTSLDTQEQHKNSLENMEQRGEQVVIQCQGESGLIRHDILRNEDDIQIDSLEDDPSARPPRPGTIAEREHLKWQHATPMLNNPYSEENITRRLGRRQHSILQTQTSNQSLKVSKSTTHTDITNQQPLKINCSSPTVDFKQYGRDYYINEIKSAKKMENNPEEVTDTPQDDANTMMDLETIQNEPMLIEEPVLSGAPSLTSLMSEDHADSALGSATSAISFDEEEELKMPCVKELAKQFAPPLQQQRKGGRGQKTKPPSAYNNDNKSIVIVELNRDPKPPAPALVHSLTARNLSKEFRAGLRGESAQRLVENGVKKDTKGAPRPAERHRANLEFWRSLDPPAPTPAPRNLKKK